MKRNLTVFLIRQFLGDDLPVKVVQSEVDTTLIQRQSRALNEKIVPRWPKR